jgi:hypothetical protein
MRSRQFSSKDIGEKQENKRMGTKTLTSSPNNFQLKAVEAGESSTVDSSKGVAQLNPLAAARTGGKLLESLAPHLIKTGTALGSAAGHTHRVLKPFAKPAATAVSAATGFNTVADMGGNAAHLLTGAAFNDKATAADGATGFLKTAVSNRVPEHMKSTVDPQLEALQAHFLGKFKGDEVLKRDPKNTIVPNALRTVAGFFAGSPVDVTPGLDSVDKSAALASAIRDRPVEAAQEAEAARMAKDFAKTRAAHSAKYPEITAAEEKDRLKNDPAHEGFLR